MTASHSAVTSLVLSLQTLGTFGDSLGRVTTADSLVPTLPFVQHVAAPYLSHPSSAAALTCCVLLIPGSSHKIAIGSHSAVITEEILATLLRVATSDPVPLLRLSILRASDSRYDPILVQAHHLKILEPTDEVDTTLTLSELSREAQRFKLAERVLLEPLEKLGGDLNGASLIFA
jgi:hypothetical protein